MHPGRSPLLVFGEQGQSPGPKVWHQHSAPVMGPHLLLVTVRQVASSSARVPPAERGPEFPLCSMTPLILTVDFLSSPLHSLSRPLPFLFFHQLPFASRSKKKKKTQQTTTTSHKKKVHLVILSHQIGISLPNEWRLKGAAQSLNSGHRRSNPTWSDESSYFLVSCGHIRVHDGTDAAVHAG